MSTSKRGFGFLSVCILFLVPDAAFAADAIWTGLGVDDRWGDAGNWGGMQLPTFADRVIIDPTGNWGHRTVTVDSAAQAGEWKFEHYGRPNYPFNHVRLISGADLHVGVESIDQFYGSYVQSAGNHLVDGAFSYYTWDGDFRMEGGTFTAAAINAAPEAGRFSLLGGVTQTARLTVGTPVFITPQFTIGGTAVVHVSESFSYLRTSYEPPRMLFSRPVFMDGADFLNEVHVGLDVVDPFVTMHLVFRGGLGDTSLFEVSSSDKGALSAGITTPSLAPLRSAPTSPPTSASSMMSRTGLISSRMNPTIPRLRSRPTPCTSKPSESAAAPFSTWLD